MLTDVEARYYVALSTLLRSKGFREEMENANYHSALEFLEEIQNYGYFKKW